MIEARVMPGSGRRLRGPCPTCRDSMKKGQLWMGGKEYIQCPDCGGSGVFRFYEERVQPPPSRIFVCRRIE